MPLPDYPHRAMEECKAAGFDYETLSKKCAQQQKDLEELSASRSEQVRLVAKLRDTLRKCVESFENETPGGARQHLTFRWAKIVLEEEFGQK